MSRKYYEEHREEILKQKKEYYARNKDAILEQRRAYRAEHKEEIADYQRAYKTEHRAELAEYYREYNSDPEAREKNRIRQRDRKRLIKLGFNLDGMEVHHIKYCSDDNDDSWFENIRIYTPAQHDILHKWERMDHDC